jgi:hypothetical protein
MKTGCFLWYRNWILDHLRVHVCVLWWTRWQWGKCFISEYWIYCQYHSITAPNPSSKTFFNRRTDGGNPDTFTVVRFQRVRPLLTKKIHKRDLRFENRKALNKMWRHYWTVSTVKTSKLRHIPDTTITEKNSRNVKTIAGLITQSIWLKKQVTLASLGWCHKKGECAKSCARGSECFCGRRCGGASIGVLT